MLFHFPAKQPGWQQNMGEVYTCINRPSTNYWPIVDSLVKKLWSVSQVSVTYQWSINFFSTQDLEQCLTNMYINWLSTDIDYQELVAGHHEIIVRCSLSLVVSQQKLKKLYQGIISQAQRKHETTCFKRRSSFFWIWCTNHPLWKCRTTKILQHKQYR